MIEYEIKGVGYKSGKLDVFIQSNIVRRIAPLLGDIAPALRFLKTDPMMSFKIVAGSLSRMTDDDMLYVQRACLQVTQRHDANNLVWANLMSPSGQLMFEDMDLFTMNKIVFLVLKDNLSDFFQEMRHEASGLGNQT